MGVKTDYKVGIPAHSFVHSFIDDISALMSSLGGRRRVDTSNVLSNMVQVSQGMCASPWRNQLAPSISPSAKAPINCYLRVCGLHGAVLSYSS